MSRQLRIDPTRCSGHGLCAELIPEWIRLDDWGYPMLDTHPIPPALEAMAARAVEGCPKLALALVPAEVAPPGGRQPQVGPRQEVRRRPRR